MTPRSGAVAPLRPPEPRRARPPRADTSRRPSATPRRPPPATPVARRRALAPPPARRPPGRRALGGSPDLPIPRTHPPASARGRRRTRPQPGARGVAAPREMGEDARGHRRLGHEPHDPRRAAAAGTPLDVHREDVAESLGPAPPAGPERRPGVLALRVTRRHAAHFRQQHAASAPPPPPARGVGARVPHHDLVALRHVIHPARRGREMQTSLRNGRDRRASGPAVGSMRSAQPEEFRRAWCSGPAAGGCRAPERGAGDG